MKSKLKKSGQLTSIAEIFEGFFKQGNEYQNGQIQKICETWSKFVGKQIAMNASPVSFKKSVLLVHVSSSVWIQHLSFVKKDIINNLNRYVKIRINDIKFKIGSI